MTAKRNKKEKDAIDLMLDQIDFHGMTKDELDGMDGLTGFPDAEAGSEALEDFGKKWNSKYPMICKSWSDNWNDLVEFFNYPGDIRRAIYTTNASAKWTMPIKEWGLAVNQFAILFEGRVPLC